MILFEIGSMRNSNRYGKTCPPVASETYQDCLRTVCATYLYQYMQGSSNASVYTGTADTIPEIYKHIESVHAYWIMHEQKCTDALADSTRVVSDM